jgi:peptide/nickel transport system permease protein
MPERHRAGQPAAGSLVAHFFGTDQLGRDLFSRTVYGTRIAISVAVVVLSISLTIGILLGVIAAYAPDDRSAHPFHLRHHQLFSPG